MIHGYRVSNKWAGHIASQAGDDLMPYVAVAEVLRLGSQQWSQDGGGTSPITKSHTCTAGTTTLVVGFADASGGTVTAATYNGVAADHILNFPSGRKVAILVFHNPDTSAAHDIVLTLSSSATDYAMFADDLSGVDQGTAPVTASNSGSSSPVTVNITPGGDGGMVYLVFSAAWNGTTGSGGAGQNTIFHLDMGVDVMTATYEKTTSGAANAQTWSFSSIDPGWNAIAMALPVYTGVRLDSATATLSLTPSATDVDESLDSNTAALTLTPSALESVEYIDSQTAVLALQPSGPDVYIPAGSGIDYLDSNTATLSLQPSGADLATYVDATTATLALQPSHTETYHTLDAAQALLRLTPLAADTAQFVDSATGVLTFTITAHECFFRYAPTFEISARKKWGTDGSDLWGIEAGTDVWFAFGTDKWDFTDLRKWSYSFAGKAHDLPEC